MSQLHAPLPTASKSKPVRGFTLLEMVVSVGLFSVVMIAATSAYLALIAIDKQARATTEVSDNLSYALDTMSRSIRTGTSYQCYLGGTNTTCGSGFTFFDTVTGQNISYVLGSNGSIGQCTGACVGAPVALTDPRITVKSLTFYIRGVGTGLLDADTQPHVTFVIHGSIATDSKHKPVDFVIESSATERVIEI